MLLIDEVNELIPGQRITATFWVDPARATAPALPFSLAYTLWRPLPRPQISF